MTAVTLTNDCRDSYKWLPWLLQMTAVTLTNDCRDSYKWLPWLLQTTALSQSPPIQGSLAKLPITLIRKTGVAFAYRMQIPNSKLYKTVMVKKVHLVIISCWDSYKVAVARGGRVGSFPWPWQKKGDDASD